MGVVFTIAAGMVAGKEGPFVHGGGIVGGGLGAMGSQYAPDMPHQFFRLFALLRSFVALLELLRAEMSFASMIQLCLPANRHELASAAQVELVRTSVQ